MAENESTIKGRKWREKNREHYKKYQREYKRRLRAKQKLERETNGGQ